MVRRLLCFLSAIVLAAQTGVDGPAIARKALDALLNARYSEVFQMSTEDMQKSMPEQGLAQLGAQIKGFGAVTKIGDPVIQRSGPNTIAIFPVSFEKQTLNIRTMVNGSGQLAMLILQQADIPWEHPPYNKAGSYTEREVTVTTDDWKLPGTLSIPIGNGPFPAVVLVHGSGPNDRDQTVAANKVFKDLAEGLASRGVAVLRYEKRSKVAPARFSAIQDQTIDDETVDDASSAVELLKDQKEIDGKKIYVLGYGLGGYIAPRIAVDSGEVAGLIILAGHARPLEDLILEQATYLGASPAKLEDIKAGVKKIKSLEPADAGSPKILGMNVSYLLDLKNYDPVASARKLNMPILILQGERDFQTTLTDYNLWKTGLASRKDVTLKSYPTLNHLFIAGEGRSTESEYRKPGHVAPEVIDQIAKFLGR